MHPLHGALSVPYMPLGVYTRFFGRTSIYLCASSLQNLAVPYTFIPFSVCETIFLIMYSIVGLTGFKTRANVFLLA